MKLSICVHEWTTKDGKRKFNTASSKGIYLEGVKKLEVKDDSTNFDIRFTQGSIDIPAKEGVYDIYCDDAWVDTRPETKYPTIRCKNVTKADFKCEFKKQ